MKKLLLFLPFAFLLSCRTDESVNPGNLPETADSAPIKRKLYYWSAKESNATREQTFEYGAEGRLVKIVDYNRTGQGKMEMAGYEEYSYNASGQLTRQINYYRDQGTTFRPQREMEYEYDGQNQVVERWYSFLYTQGVRTLTYTIRNDYSNGRKSARREYDMQNKLVLKIEYSYTKGALSKETTFGPDGQQWRQFVHNYNRNYLFQTEEYAPSVSKRISLREFSYDGRGRLSQEETKEVNMLLCAMIPGIVRYEY